MLLIIVYRSAFTSHVHLITVQGGCTWTSSNAKVELGKTVIAEVSVIDSPNCDHIPRPSSTFLLQYPPRWLPSTSSSSLKLSHPAAPLASTLLALPFSNIFWISELTKVEPKVSPSNIAYAVAKWCSVRSAWNWATTQRYASDRKKLQYWFRFTANWIALNPEEIQ